MSWTRAVSVSQLGLGVVIAACSGGSPLRPELPIGPSTGEAVSAPASSSREGGMVLVPTGTFAMGSDDGAADEKPVHQVKVDAFWMDVTEVTVAAYSACVRAGGCAEATTADEFCNATEIDRQTHPINCVSWNEAGAYCRWMSKRLPTEEEWEYAARGSEGRRYPWGNEAPADQLCWKRSALKEGTCAVGSYPAGLFPLGLLDMAGNLWEWTSSGYSDDYSTTRSDAVRVVIRGGSWGALDAPGVRSTGRAGSAPSSRRAGVGFRCSREK